MNESSPLLVSRLSLTKGNGHHGSLARSPLRLVLKAGEKEGTKAAAGAAAGGRTRLRVGYACGHAQNDLCGAMYFSYLLVYLDGIGLSPVGAGAVLIAGQLVDGAATPVVGILSDRLSSSCCTDPGCCFGLSGRRKAWYIGGMVLVTSTFWALFTPYPTNHGGAMGVIGAEILRIIPPPVVYYALANCLFQIGWASVQVSHMALVPELTPLLSERLFLNSIRFAVTVGTSITVYLLVWAFSAADKKSGGDSSSGGYREETEQKHEEQDLMRKLHVISYIVLLLGALLGLLFICLVREKGNSSAGPTAAETTICPITNKRIAIDPIETDGDNNPTSKTLRGWFQTPGFYGVTANYSLTRLCVNTLQVYLPFFVLYTMSTSSAAVATVPLTAYVGMCASSILAPRVSAVVTDAACLYADATACLLVGSLLLLLTPVEGGSRLAYFLVFLGAGLLGIGGAQLMVTSQTQVCELVGSDSNGGVVFGINSFCDKVSTGLVIYIVQRLAQESDEAGLGSLYRRTAAGVPLGCAVLGGLALLSVPRIIRDRHGCTKQDEADERSTEESDAESC